MTRLVSLLVLAAVLLVPALACSPRIARTSRCWPTCGCCRKQASRLQLATNQLSEQLKVVNGRLDQSADANVKTFANQQLLINQIAANLTTGREKLDDNTVRVSQLTQEFSAVRDGLRMLTDHGLSVSLLQPPRRRAAPGATGAPPGCAFGRRGPGQPALVAGQPLYAGQRGLPQRPLRPGHRGLPGTHQSVSGLPHGCGRPAKDSASPTTRRRCAGRRFRNSRRSLRPTAPLTPCRMRFCCWGSVRRISAGAWKPARHTNS